MRRKTVGTISDKINPMQALLAALSDDLALPLIQVKSAVENMGADNFSKQSARASADQINLSVDNGLQLIEAYRLTLTAHNIDQMAFEPVTIGGVLQDIAHELTPYAKKYATDIEVSVSGKLTPVLTHQPSLHAVIQVLAACLIRAQSAQVQQKRYKMILGAHRTSEAAISTGVFSQIEGLSDKTLRSARSLTGRARQPLPAVPAGAASGVLIADMLCSTLWQPLRAAAHGGLHGLATSIPISKQLSFV